MTKVAVVSAAASGIGAAVVRKLLHEGWLVVALDRDETGLATLGATWTISGDARNEGLWVKANEAVRNLDRVSHLGVVSGVGGAMFRGSRELTDDDWFDALELNLFSAVRAVRVMLPLLESVPSGAIVTIGSISGRRSDAIVPSYCAAKAALESWTMTLALELARTKVRVNSVHPGATETPGLIANIARKGGRPDDLKVRAEAQPRGTLIQPEEVAAAVEFLLSPNSLKISGTSIVIDGGLTQRMPG